MYISHKSNVLEQIHETEWNCRRNSKGQTKAEYWAWVETITDSDGVVTYPSEDFTIVECTDEDVYARLAQLDDYQSISSDEVLVYNIKWSDSKDTFVMTTDMAGKSVKVVESEEKDEDGKVTKTNYKMSHFSGDDTAKDKRILDAEWTQIRAKRDRLLTSSDWTQANDTPLTDANVAKWKTYRTSLRDLPSDQSSKTKYSDITWPTKP